jgi:hypothetical protein
MSNAQVVLIAGSGRSGSTLLEQMLTENSRSISVGELKYLWSRGLLRNELCSCGKPALECEFWTQVTRPFIDENRSIEGIEELRLQVERHRHFFLYRILRLPSAKYAAARKEYLGILETLYSSIYDASSGAMIIDSSKDPAHIELASAIFSRPQILHLIRDSRAVVYSWQTPKRRSEVYWKEEYIPKISVLRSISDWMFINLSIMVFFSRRREYRRVRYEDLFCQGSQKEIVNSFVRSSPGGGVSHSISGNPQRFEKIQRPKVLDERWKSGMPYTAQIMTSVLTAPLLLLYGYHKRTRSEG